MHKSSHSKGIEDFYFESDRSNHGTETGIQLSQNKILS